MKRLLSSVLLVVITFGSLYSQVTKGDSPFYERMRTLSLDERETLIYKEITSGNIPDYLKTFVAIKTVQKDTKGKRRKVTLFVKPDYLSIGNDKNSFIIPMCPFTAQRIADTMNCSLPTPKVVDIIYLKSDLKLEPFNYIPRGNRNETPDILNDHSRVIFAQIKAAGKEPGVFVAGTKKDVVICSKLNDPQKTHHVIIYGWHKLDGKAIQPAYNGHIDIYVDYSHGIRLVSNRVLIDGKEYNYREVLKDSILHSLLSDEPEPLVKTSYLEK